MKKSAKAAKSVRKVKASAPPAGERPTYFFQKQLKGEEPLTWHTAQRLCGMSIAISMLQPWTILADNDLFLLQDPVSGRMCHCSTMGALGEVFSLHAYVGGESYLLFQRINSGAKVTSGEFLESQTAVSVEFVEPAEVTAPDRELLKWFGHPLRKGFRAPIFRALRPGYHPWYMTEPEANTLAACMQALLALCEVLRAKSGDVAFWEKEGAYPLMTLITGQGGDCEYRINVVTPEIKPTVLQPPALEAARIRNLCGNDYAVRGCFEADYFTALAKIGGRDERKSCMRASLVADAASGFLFRPKMGTPLESRGQILADAVLNAIEDIHSLPSEIRVNKDEYKAMLDPLAQQLGISVNVAPSLPSVERARASLLSMMGVAS